MIYWFDQVGADDIAVVGGKGANLGECFNAGLPVPPGFVVGTEAYSLASRDVSEAVVRAAESKDYRHAQNLIRSLEIPADLMTAVERAYAKLGEPVVAVRSSATAEDLAEASFAGQQDSVLGVRGIDALWHAVQECWVSLWNERAIEYRAKQGIENSGLALAVVVQEMVDADVAGVLFTQNPMANDDHMLASASYGLGESVVAATVTPDTLELSRVTHEIVSSTIGSKETRIDMVVGGTEVSEVPTELRSRLSLDTAQVADLAELGLNVEQYYGSPQDIEWAFSGDKLFLLQSRPITTVVSNVEPHFETNNRMERVLQGDLIEHYPAPYPIDLVAVHALQNAIQIMMRKLGLRAAKAESLILGDADGIIRVRAVAPKITPSLFIKLPLMFRKGMSHNPDAWDTEEAEAASRRSELLARANQVAEITGEELDELLRDILAEASALMRYRFLYYLAPMMVWRGVAERQIQLAKLKGAIAVEDLYEDLEYVTADISSSISVLADSARDQGLGEIIAESPPEDLISSLNFHPSGSVFVSEIRQFLERRGARTSRMYLPFSNQSWREKPEQFLELLAVSLRSDTKPKQDKVPAVELVRDSLPVPLRSCWAKTVRKLRALHVGREGTLYQIEELFVVARIVMTEISERLIRNGSIERLADAQFLYYEEVLGGLEHPNPALQGTVANRRSKRGAAEAVWWSRKDGATGTEIVSGTPGSPGQAVGIARVIHTPAEFSRLEQGDILVCPFTDPTWTPLFSVAGGVVADVGGPLSHAAIVAREYGIPAVLGTGNATSQIKDGTSILVDGEQGLVSPVD